MSKLSSIVFVVGISLLEVVDVQAMPFAPRDPAQAGLTIPVSSGCGLGVRRGPYDGCTPVYDRYNSSYYNGYYNGYYEGYYAGYNDAYYGDYGRSGVVESGPCWGRGTHRVCNGLGLCWRACN